MPTTQTDLCYRDRPQLAPKASEQSCRVGGIPQRSITEDPTDTSQQVSATALQGRQGRQRFTARLLPGQSPLGGQNRGNNHLRSGGLLGLRKHVEAVIICPTAHRREPTASHQVCRPGWLVSSDLNRRSGQPLVRLASGTPRGFSVRPPPEFPAPNVS